MKEIVWHNHTNQMLRDLLKERNLPRMMGGKARLVTRLIGDSILPKREVNSGEIMVLLYDDRHDWGKQFLEAMREIKGVNCSLFKKVVSVIYCNKLIESASTCFASFPTNSSLVRKLLKVTFMGV